MTEKQMAIDEIKKYSPSEKKYFYKLINFSEIEDLDKFSRNSNIRFPNYSKVSNWFYNNIKIILSADDYFSKIIKEQYRVYLKNTILCKNFIEEDIDFIWKFDLKDFKFYAKLIYFSRIKDLNKFNSNYSGKFYDDKLVKVWLYANLNKILKLDDEYSLKVQKQYKYYIENIYVSNFDKKIYEFEKEKDLNKFSFRHSEVTFSDGTIMPIWFSTNKEKIFNSNNRMVLSIKKQYSQYKSTLGRISYDVKLKEFLNIKDLIKFNKTVLNNLKFSDGTSVKEWFEINCNNILSCNDDVCKEIEKQYNEYINSEYNIKPNEKIYLNRLKEFEKEKDLHKFSCNHTEVTFSDGVIMPTWFAVNKKKILSSDDKLSISIQNQHKDYKEKQGIFNKVPFEVRLKEFKEEKNLQKFNTSKEEIRFKDGSVMSFWFVNHKQKIISSTTDDGIEVKRQYEEYNNIRISKTFEDRLQEFYENENPRKFIQNRNEIKFEDGTKVGPWFSHNKRRILSSDDITCVLIAIQYYEFKKSSENQKKYKDKLDDIKKKAKN